MGYVYSTLSSNNVFICYKSLSNDPKDPRLPIVDVDDNGKPKTILIKGGTGVYREHIQTPQGVMTEVSDKDLEWLESEYSFMDHVRNGYIKVERSKSSRAAEKAIHDLKPKDKSAQLVEKDFAKSSKDGTPLIPKLNSLQDS